MIITNYSPVAVIAAHPDDEILGAGATAAVMADAGAEVHLIVLGEGIGARFTDNKRPDEAVKNLREEVRRAADRVGAASHHLSLPDNRFDTVATLDVVHAVEGVLNLIKPSLVITHHPGDLNVDHRVTANAVLTAFRPLPGSRDHALLAFETLSSTEWNVPTNGATFSPNVFVDVASGIKRKVEAMAEYHGELREWPHPRSLDGIRTLASSRGMTVGCDFAEAFQLLRLVTRFHGTG
jgi:LmbE family N-acetylglucosaminyl deacetylase